MTASRSRSRRRAIVVLAPLAALLLAFVGVVAMQTARHNGGSGSSGAEVAHGGAARSDGDMVAPARGSAPASAARKGAAGATGETLSRAVISRGSLWLRTADVARTRARIEAELARWDASISDERTDTDRPGHIDRVQLTLRVPTRSFQDALSALSRLGRVSSITQSTQDVSTQVADVDARVRAMAAGVRRVEALLGRATSLSQVIAIETSLSQRQADLDSLRSQQATLADQTALSTITLTLARQAPPAHLGPVRHAGFLAGLRAGGRALLTTVRGVGVGLGAALPFAVVGGLLGLPTWLLWRRRRRATAG